MIRRARTSAGRGLALLAGLGLAIAVGCYDGPWLVFEPCTKKSDCGRGQDCVDGLCLECVGSVCNPYICPVTEVDDVCPCPGRAKYTCHELASARTNKVDILFVIDNSPGSNQHRLIQLEKDLVALLDKGLADYRVAITTTDSGNPACAEEDTTPENGSFVFSSCRERDEDNDGVSDPTAECLEHCVHETIAVKESPIDDGERDERQWLEVSPAGTNLDGDIPVDEALACLILPDVKGCTFESPLESLHLALERTDTQGDPNYGFLRDDAHLMVVIFTNDADCSYNPNYAEIFDPDGGKTFWSDPAAEAPTPAVCWNAGVECIGGPTQYYDCVPVDRDLAGDPTLDEDAAVLHPLGRYLEKLEAIKADKRERNPNLEVAVTLIAGVPRDYDGSTFPYVSVAETDPEYEGQFGIGPGCVNDGDGDPISAVPPVRMLEIAEVTRPQSGADNVFSICEDDLGEAFNAIAELVTSTIPPQCMPACVADAATCELAYFEDGSSQPIPRCAGGDLPMLGEDGLCFHTIEGESVAPECLAQGWNVQFGFLNSVGVEIPEQIFASCAPSNDADTDCPSSTGG